MRESAVRRGKHGVGHDAHGGEQAQSPAGAGGGLGLFSAVCVMPYAVFTSAYSGLSQGAWVSYFLPLAQAVTASLLARRLRRKEAKQK